MILKGNRRTAHPIIISENKEAVLLQRISYTDKLFAESWLQEIIHQRSSLLPIYEIEPSFSDAISLGREILTKVGYIDNLLINEDGYITIIETKLWRNLQARREVVGQVIDYAKELTKWNFADLDNAVRRSHPENKGIVDVVKAHADGNDFDETNFIDIVSRNLSKGRFLLLIIGDGIHESVEEMAEYLQQFAQINFTLALIELQVYKNQHDQSLLVLPQVITKTKEITRAVIRIEQPVASSVNIDVQTNLNEVQQDNIQVKNTLTYDDFFVQLGQNSNEQIVAFVKQVINDCEQRGMLIEFGISTVGFKLLDNNNNKISAFFIDRKEFFYIWYVGNQLHRRGYNAEIGNKFAAHTAELFGLKLTYTDDLKCSWNKYLRVQDLQNKYAQFLECLDTLVDDFNKEMKAKTI